MTGTTSPELRNLRAPSADGRITSSEQGDEPRVAVLLGAGASVDAGLCMTEALAAQIVARANREMPTAPATQALNFVYGQTVGFRAETGNDPLAAVNIEMLVSALRLLKNRNSHEVAPFVSTWKSGAFGFGEQTIASDLGAQLIDALRRELPEEWHNAPNSHRGASADAVASIARSAVDASSSQSFQDAEEFVLRCLREQLSQLQAVSYLAPICDLATQQPGGLDVISLNYDRAVQDSAEKARVPVDIGVDRWVPGQPLGFSYTDGMLRLIKVHGSIDWSTPSSHEWPRSDPMVDSPRISVGNDPADQRTLPWIVVGDREKLATDGPTLPLVQAALSALVRASHLVVVGYSFRDAHINGLIRDWMTSDDERTMTVLDPGWPDADNRTDARVSWMRRYGRPPLGQDVDNGFIPRLRVIRKYTRDGLFEALGERIAPDPDPYVLADTTSQLDGETIQFRLKLKVIGPALDDVLPIVALDVDEPRTRVRLYDSEADRDAGQQPIFMSWPGPRRTRSLGTGDEWIVFGAAPAGTSNLVLDITGRCPLTGAKHFRYEVVLNEVVEPEAEPE